MIDRKKELHKHRCILLHPVMPTYHLSSSECRRCPEGALREAEGLCLSIDLNVEATFIQKIHEIRPATLIGKGAVDMFATFVAQHNINLVVVNYNLSPIQQRNLERSLKCKVIDRTGLILEIFGARARTAEGRLQVELAALGYQKSRLVRSWTHLERQRGGFGFMGGPGESQLEIDKRLIAGRMEKIRKDLEKVKKTRGLHRRARSRKDMPIVVLVGYTNAGKSTLFNRLTRASVLAKDQLFATLDPTMRVVRLASGRRFILADTVGFISDLPHNLIESFHATLEEVQQADIIVHVRDMAHFETEVQALDVESVLEQLNVQSNAVHRVDVYNKVDLIPEHRKPLYDETNNHVALSAHTGEGVEQFLQMLDKVLDTFYVRVTIPLLAEDVENMAWLYKHSQILSQTSAENYIYYTIDIHRNYYDHVVNYIRTNQKQSA